MSYQQFKQDFEKRRDVISKAHDFQDCKIDSLELIYIHPNLKTAFQKKNMFSSANDRFSDSRPVIMCVYFCSQRMHHRRDGKGQKLRGEAGLPAPRTDSGNVYQYHREERHFPLYLGGNLT